MISDLSFEYSPLWLVPVLLGAAAAVWVLYFSGKTFKSSRRYLLAALRFLVFFILGLLLLSPLLKYYEVVEDKPLLIWLEDRSSSMVSGKDSSAIKNFSNAEIPKTLAEMEDRYRVVRYNFSEGIENSSGGNFKGEQTDIYRAVEEAAERHYNENIGGMVLMTDGIYNLGVNPVYGVSAIPFPVYSLGIGDTTVEKDLYIDNITQNRISYLNNEFPVEISIRGRRLKGENYNLTILNSASQVVYRSSGIINSEDYFESINAYVKATEIGIKRFTVNLNILQGETNTQNNSRSFNIEIIDNRKKIWIIGNGPHPDMSALGAALQGLEKYEVKTFVFQDMEEGNDKPDLYILHEPDTEMLNLIKDSEKPFWVVNGSSSGAGYNNLAGINMRSNTQPDEASLITDPAFSLFVIDEKLLDFTRKLPPLIVPFGKISASGTINTLFYKKIGNVETREPLWFFRESEKQRSAHTIGSGLWRWRVQDYRNNGSFEQFDDLMARSVQYLTARKQDSRFIVENKTRYSTSQDILMNARLYNKSLELDNSPEVEMKISSEDGKTYDFSFSRNAQIYQLNAGNLPSGNYSYSAKTVLGEETFNRNGVFSVQKLQVEQADLVARHDLLRNIADETEGKFYTLDDLENLKQDLLNNEKAQSIQRQKKNVSSLLNKKWIFFILLLLLAIEWSLRKYLGKY